MKITVLEIMLGLFLHSFLVSLDNGADTRAREAVSQVWNNQAATCGALNNENNAEPQLLNWTLKANLPVYRLVR